MITFEASSRGPRVLILVLLGMVVLLACIGKGSPELAIRMQKAEYMEGEPIGIEISIANPGQEEAKVMFDYPRFGLATGTFQIDARDAGLKAKTFEPGTGGVVPTIRVTPGETFTTTIFLQRFVEQPGPGKYQIPFSLELARADASPIEGGNTSFLKSRGRLSFLVRPTAPGQLDPILRRYAESLDEEAYWTRRVAVEALSVTDDPIVVPYLKRILSDPSRGALGLKALERFPNESDARAAIIEVLDSDQFLVVAQALEVLGRWKYELEFDKVRSLVGQTNTHILNKVLKYMVQVDGDKYRQLSPAVSKFLDSQDPTLVAGARGLLERWGSLTEEEDRRARRTVMALLRSEYASDVIKSLDVLADWDEEITAEDIQALKKRGATIRGAVDEYVRRGEKGGRQSKRGQEPF